MCNTWAVLVAVSGREAPHKLCVGLHVKVPAGTIAMEMNIVALHFPTLHLLLAVANSKYTHSKTAFTVHRHTAASAGMVYAPNMVDVW